MRPTRFILPMLAGLALAGPSLAQAKLPAQESRALELKASGRYAEAMQAFLELLEQTAAEPLAAARAEYHAAMTNMLAERSGDYGVRQRFLAIANGDVARAFPQLRDRCLHHALRLAELAGDHAMAAVLTGELGYILPWMLIGPFDNERGGGFGRSFEPEQTIDLDASYEGSKRAVRWRPCPVANPTGGVIQLDAMFRPNDQVLGYAAVALIAERDTDAVLHVGSDEAVKVFLNGATLLERDVVRRFAPDQDAVAIRLHRGPNLLLMKVCEQEGRFEFAVRLRAIDGTKLEGVSASIERSELLAAAATEPASETAQLPPLGARTLLQQSVDATSDPGDAMRLGMLLALDQPDDQTERRDHKLAQIAVRGLPEVDAARYLLAFTRVRSGRSEERDENQRRADYRTMLQRSPDHAEALRSLGELELDNVGTSTTSLRLFDRAAKVSPSFPGARLGIAKALDELDLRELADAEVRTAAAPNAAGVRSPSATAQWFDRLKRQQLWRDAFALAGDRLAAGFDANAVRSVTDVALRIGERDFAAELLQRAIAHLPFQRGPRRRMARLLESERDFGGALAVLSDWLRICPEDDVVLADVARLHGRSGDVERQREFLRSVVELNPNRKTERRYLEFLMSDEVPFYETFRIDSATARIGDASVVPADASKANDPYVYLLQHDVFRAYRNGTTSQYHHEIVRILNDQGARDLSSFYVPYFWGEQRARLLHVRIVKADGQELRPQLRGSYVRMPPLAPGDTCDIAYRIDDLAPSFFGEYFGLEHGFAANDGSPVLRSVLDVVLESGRDYKLQSVNGAPEPASTASEDGATVHHYEMTDLARRKAEELRPDLSETEPLVRITTYRDWTQFASWWWNLIRKQSDLTPEMTAKVAELTRGCETELEKIDAIYRFVTTDINYKAWEFGVHGYQPYTTPVIFERRHGDCKDKALLMNVMLGSVGIEAYPVLIYADPARSADDLSLPMVQHFNHCISYLPATDNRPEMYLDGTATYHPLDTLPDMDQGASVLVVSRGDGEIREIDWVTAEQNVDARRFEVELEANGAANITMIHEPTRNEAVWVRDYLGNEPAKRREHVERMLTSMFGGVEIESIETSDLLDLEAPVRLEVKFRCPEFATVQQGSLVLKPALREDSLQSLASANERDFALVLGVPNTLADSVTYKLPSGYEVLEIPAPIQIAEQFGSFKSEWSTPANGQLRVERKRSQSTNRIEPQEYPEFRDYAAEIDRADLRVVLVKRRNS